MFSNEVIVTKRFAMEYSALVQQIVDKGKRGAAEYIKTSRSPNCLDLVLDRFLNHETPINDNESIEWIKWLIAGGETPDDFTAIGELSVFYIQI